MPIGVLVLLGCAAYANSTDVPFVFDDLATIEANRNVRAGDYSAFSPGLYVQTRSLLFATFDLNNRLGGQNLLGYHVFNLILHLLNGILVFAMGVKILRKAETDSQVVQKYALLAAAFFVVHPIQTESVTYISSRSELLSTAFYLLAFLFFLMTPENSIGFLTSLVVSALMALGFGAKETVVTLPATILLYDYLFVAKCKAAALFARWRFYAAFVILAAVGSYYLLAKQVIQLAATGQALPRWSYFLTQQRVIFKYIQLLVLPAGLNLDYDFRPSVSLLEPAVLLSVALFLGFFVAAWRWRRTAPILTFSIFWFFITLAPTSSVIPIPDVIFEHRVYLPLAGACLSFPFVIERLVKFLQRSVGEKLRLKISPIAIGSALVLALLTATILRNEVWRDETRLWSDIIKKSPRKARAYNGLAQAYFRRGEYEKAVDITRKGLESATDNELGFYGNMGQFLLGLNRHDEALQAFSKALERATTPADRARGYYNLAVTYLQQWDALKAKESQIRNDVLLQEKDKLLSSAEDALKKSIELDTTYLPAWDSYMNVAVERGTQESLRIQLQQLLQSNPARALYGLAKLCFQERNYKEAANYFKQAAALYPGEKMFFFNYAYALEEIGDVDHAVQQYVQATKLDPLFLAAHHNVAQLYMEKGQYEKAIEHFEQVLRIDAKSTLAHLQLARIYIQRGQRLRARNHLSAVFSLSPGNAEATALWRQTGS